MMAKRTYTVAEICDILRISRPTAYKLIKSGVFHSVKIKNILRISKQSFDTWLDDMQNDHLGQCQEKCVSFSN